MRRPVMPALLVSVAFAVTASAASAPPALRVSPTPQAVPVVKHFAVKRPAPRRVAMRHVPHKPVPHGISVPMDEVRVVQFSQQISTVYVGNPAIADVSMIDSRHAFVLGKGFGGTNLVALDAEGKQVVNEPIGVSAPTGGVVTLQRGPAQVTYACAGSRCESSPMPGDDKDSYETRMGQLEKHQDLGVKAASEGH